MTERKRTLVVKKKLTPVLTEALEALAFDGGYELKIITSEHVPDGKVFLINDDALDKIIDRPFDFHLDPDFPSRSLVQITDI